MNHDEWCARMDELRAKLLTARGEELRAVRNELLDLAEKAPSLRRKVQDPPERKPRGKSRGNLTLGPSVLALLLKK